MAKKGKNKAPSEFTADSKRFCDICKLDVQIGTGGEANWQRHIDSIAHGKCEKSSKSLPKRSIASFFSGPSSSRASASSAASTPLLSADISLIKSPRGHPEAVQTIIDVDELPSHTLSASWSTPLLTTLSRVSASLPTSVPIADSSDDLAFYSTNPALQLEDDDDPWETVDRALNRTIGYGKTTQEIAGIIRRGELGVDGLVKWLHACVIDLKINEALLENKIERLIEAMVSLGATRGDISSTPPPVKDSSAIAAIIHKTTPPPKEKVRAVKRMIRTCPGYELQFPDGQSPFGSYPYLLHVKQHIPWTIISYDDRSYYLRHEKCDPKRSRDTASACIDCMSLDRNTIVMGIRHRALDGIHPNTPWMYYGPVHFYDALTKKTNDMNTLKLTLLNKSRTLAIWNRHLDAWKHLSVAIGREDIPRLRTLMATELRHGSSVFSIIEKVEKAVRRFYLMLRAIALHGMSESGRAVS